jgi:hypothetical protein
MRPLIIDALIALQGFVVAFIALHDWVPLGALNDVSAVQAADPRSKLITVTALSTAPFAVGLGGTIAYAGARFPEWLTWYLWISYGAVVFGVWRAWWGPYLLGGAGARATRYKAMFARTHAFMPERNGIRPNTLHVTLHVVVIAILVLLGFLSFSIPQAPPA